MNSRYRKELGAWGEQQLDAWMQRQGWDCTAKNLRIRGGEIDRMYSNSLHSVAQICLAEVKTNVVNTTQELQHTFSEIGIKKYLKQRQLRNLYRYGEFLLAQNGQQVFLRLFIILKFKNSNKFNFQSITNNSAIKICHWEKNLVILSIVPEFTDIQSRKSLLQVKV